MDYSMNVKLEGTNSMRTNHATSDQNQISRLTSSNFPQNPSGHLLSGQQRRVSKKSLLLAAMHSTKVEEVSVDTSMSSNSSSTKRQRVKVRVHPGRERGKPGATSGMTTHRDVSSDVAMSYDAHQVNSLEEATHGMQLTEVTTCTLSSNCIYPDPNVLNIGSNYL